MNNTDHAKPDMPPPSSCPACRSADIATASKHADASAYWRCSACGEVWNVDRQRTSRRYGSGGR
jgi:transposase-like protein